MSLETADLKVSTRQRLILDELQGKGMRITKQRLGLVKLLWASDHDQHISAEKLFSLARHAGLGLSLATVYNTLNHWAERGLLRRVQLNQHNMTGHHASVYFDTNIKAHHHFFDEDQNSLIDIEQDEIQLKNLPSAPEGKKISGVDVFIRINKNPLA